MTARARWWSLAGARMAGLGGALLGVALLARAPGWGAKALGVTIVLSAMVMTASVTGHLAHKWRSGR